MISKILNKLVIVLLITTSACRTSRHVPAPTPEGTAQFPIFSIGLPITDPRLLIPPVPGLEESKAPHKDITEALTAREKNNLALQDAKLFEKGNTEIIDLSLIPEKESAFPLKGAKVISPYGGRRKHHTGMDIKTCANDTIVAAFDGLVRMAMPYAAYGNVIVIRHYNGLETIYSHNSKNFVEPGNRVKAGQPIALTGRTGRATTEHLHFEVRINGQHFNPNIIFNFDKNKLRRKCLVFSQKGNGIHVKSVNILPHQSAGNYSYMPDSK